MVSNYFFLSFFVLFFIFRPFFHFASFFSFFIVFYYVPSFFPLFFIFQLFNLSGSNLFCNICYGTIAAVFNHHKESGNFFISHQNSWNRIIYEKKTFWQITVLKCNNFGMEQWIQAEMLMEELIPWQKHDRDNDNRAAETVLYVILYFR